MGKDPALECRHDRLSQCDLERRVRPKVIRNALRVTPLLHSQLHPPLQHPNQRPVRRVLHFGIGPHRVGNLLRQSSWRPPPTLSHDTHARLHRLKKSPARLQAERGICPQRVGNVLGTASPCDDPHPFFQRSH